MFFIVQFQEFFIGWSFFTVCLLPNLTMVFCVLEVGLSIQWRASIPLAPLVHQCPARLIWPYSLNYCQVHSHEYHWRLHYCICHTEPNHYDLILVCQLCFHILLSAWHFHPAIFLLLYPSNWWSHLSDIRLLILWTMDFFNLSSKSWLISTLFVFVSGVMIMGHQNSNIN